MKPLLTLILIAFPLLFLTGCGPNAADTKQKELEEKNRKASEQREAEKAVTENERGFRLDLDKLPPAFDGHTPSDFDRASKGQPSIGAGEFYRYGNESKADFDKRVAQRNEIIKKWRAMNTPSPVFTYAVTNRQLAFEYDAVSSKVKPALVMTKPGADSPHCSNSQNYYVLSAAVSTGFEARKIHFENLLKLPAERFIQFTNELSLDRSFTLDADKAAKLKASNGLSEVLILRPTQPISDTMLVGECQTHVYFVDLVAIWFYDDATGEILHKITVPRGKID